MAVQSDKNTYIKEYDNIDKYKNLEMEKIKCSTSTTVRPIIIGAIVLIKKAEEKPINKIPRSPIKKKMWNYPPVRISIIIVKQI